MTCKYANELKRMIAICRGLAMTAPAMVLSAAGVCLAADTAEAPLIPYRAPVSNFTFDATGAIVKFVLATAVCIAILVAFKKYAGKQFQGHETDNIKVYDLKAIAPGKYIYVVEVFDHIYVLGIAGDSITKIAEIREKELIDSIRLKSDRNIKGKLFSEYLQKLIPGEKND